MNYLTRLISTLQKFYIHSWSRTTLLQVFQSANVYCYGSLMCNYSDPRTRSNYVTESLLVFFHVRNLHIKGHACISFPQLLHQIRKARKVILLTRHGISGEWNSLVWLTLAWLTKICGLQRVTKSRGVKHYHSVISFFKFIIGVMIQRIVIVHIEFIVCCC